MSYLREGVGWGSELILAQPVPPGARAAILGTGNGNDLDLYRDCADFTEKSSFLKVSSVEVRVIRGIRVP